MRVLCTTPVATGAVLGCSSVAPCIVPPYGATDGVIPAGRRLRWPHRACPSAVAHRELRADAGQVAGTDRHLRRADAEADVGPRGAGTPPGPADRLRAAAGGGDRRRVPERAGTQALGWRFATVSGPRIPMTPTPALLHLVVAATSKSSSNPLHHPASAGGDRGPRLLLLHPAPAAQGPGGPAGPGLGVRGRGRGADRRRRHRHRPRDPRRPLHAPDRGPGRRRQPRRPAADADRLRAPGHRPEDRADRGRAGRRRAGRRRGARRAARQRQDDIDDTGGDGADAAGDGAASSGDHGGEAEEA